MIKLLVNNSTIQVKSEMELIREFEKLRNDRFCEIWISGFGDASLTILMNQDKAFMMYLRNEDDSGFNSLDSEIETDEMMKFLLSNGQMDEYPLNFLVDKELAGKALLEYYKSGEMWNGIKWLES